MGPQVWEGTEIHSCRCGVRIPGSQGQRGLGEGAGLLRQGGGGGWGLSCPKSPQRRGLRAWPLDACPPTQAAGVWSPRSPRGAELPTGPSLRFPAGVISRIRATGRGLADFRAQTLGLGPDRIAGRLCLTSASFASFFLPRGRPNADGGGGEGGRARAWWGVEEAGLGVTA